MRNADVTGPEDDPVMTDVRVPDAATAPREERDLDLRSRRILGLAELLERRPELREVSAWSDEVTRHVRWSA